MYKDYTSYKGCHTLLHMPPQPGHLQPGEVLLLGETDAKVEAGKSLMWGDVHRVLVNTW